jgi:hypothetical protein
MLEGRKQLKLQAKNLTADVSTFIWNFDCKGAPVQAMKAYGGVKIYLHSLTSATDVVMVTFMHRLLHPPKDTDSAAIQTGGCVSPQASMDSSEKR